MFSITIALGNVSWRLLYRDEEKAQQAFELTRHRDGAIIFLEDDFGQKVYFPLSSLHGALFEDLEKMKMAHVETALHNARLQAMANKAAQADPGLRASAMSSSPGVLTPMNSFRPS